MKSNIELLSEFQNEYPEISEIFALVVKSEIGRLKRNENIQVEGEEDYPDFFLAVREIVRIEMHGAKKNNSCALKEDYPEIYEMTIRYIRKEINNLNNQPVSEVKVARNDAEGVLILCPNCSEKMRVEANKVQTYVCPRCSHIFKVFSKPTVLTEPNNPEEIVNRVEISSGAGDIQTALHSNAFCLLGATVRDDRNRIIELAEEKSLLHDSDICAKACSDLTTSRNRLAAEMAWLPGVSPNSAKVLVDNLHNHLDLVKKTTTAPALAKANLLAASFELIDPEMSADLWRDWIIDFANTVDMIDAEVVLHDINQDRKVAGVAPVKKLEEIEAALKERGWYYTQTIKAVLDRFSSDKLVDVVTRVVETTTENGEEYGASLVHDLIEQYEADANRYLQPETENIKKLAGAILLAAPKGESSVKPLVDKLIQIVNKWDSVAQPIQLSVKARGLEHDLSHEVANTIRSMGIELFNKHDMLDTANRLTKILQELFAELPEVVEKLDQDSETLDEIHDKREAAEKRGAEWAKEISYQAELGLVFKDTLRISPNGIEWKSELFPLDAITWVRWGAVSRSVNGVPTGTNYTIAVGDSRSSMIIATREEEIYSAFTDRLWRAVCVRLLTEALETLKSGKSISIGEAVIDDKGVQLTKHKFFGNEKEYRDWGKVTYVSSGGSLFITAQDDKKVYVSLPYLSTPNAHILEAMIRLSFKKWTGRLSGLLNE